jgi:hypothetical protein
MRVFVIAAAAIALTTAPASAQGMGKQREPDQKTDPNKDAKRKADEKAYYDALKKIPDAKQDRDPWRGAR